jgi:hypothetical protein
MKKKVFSSIFIIILLTLFIFAPIKRLFVELGLSNYNNVGNTVSYATEDDKGDIFVQFHNVVNSFIAEVDNIYINYLPFYNNIVSLSENTMLVINTPINDLLMNIAAQEALNHQSGIQETDSTLDTQNIKSEDNETVFITDYKVTFLNETATHRHYLFEFKLSDGSTASFLDRVVGYSNTWKESKLNDVIENLKRITSYGADQVNWYLYSGSRLQDMPFFTDYLPTEESTWNDLNRLFDGLPENVRYDYLKFETPIDRYNLVYRTDHHWNAYGQYLGYTQILDMMRNDTPDIGEPKKYNEYILDKVVYNGSFSRLSNYNKINDDFEFFDYSLPQHTINDNRSFNAMKEVYLSGKYNTASGVDHYDAFFPNPSKIEYPENKTNRNLLIIGDSFARSICETLASHFDTTYFWYCSGGNLKVMIERYGITDILILMYSDRLLYTIYNEMDWSQVVTGPIDLFD